MADAQEFLSVLGNFNVCFFNVIFGYILNGIIEKNARTTIKHVYFSALTLTVSLGSRPGDLGFNQLLRATANVNA